MLKSDTLVLNLFETRALWAISKKPAHGYALLKELNGNCRRKTTNGTLYPVLRKMLKRGIIRVESRGDREKKIYCITAKGKKALRRACVELCAAFESIFHDFACRTCGTRVKKSGGIEGND